ncbi:hypothetical protein BH09BAC1_BH09BAC1_08050 [soil metagenome]
MKIFTMVLLCVLLSWGAMAKKDGTINIKSLDITLVAVPQGLYMSQEITNGQYLAFLQDLIKQGRVVEAARLLPDSTQWQKEIAYCEPMVSHYFRHPAYADFPLVAITLEGANAFCAWLTEIVKKDGKLNLPNALCALPTENEWLIASAPFYDNPYPWYGPYAYNEKGEVLCNVKISRIDADVFRQYQGIGSVALTTGPESYYPNKYGLYNMIGNVAELTSEGYIKGGGWSNTIDECAVTKRQDFTLPNANVGFRVVLRPNGNIVSMNKEDK